MAEISAKQVQALRAKTDLAMMDCKKALVEAEGDETRALEILRKKFADKMSDRAHKEMANGRIGVFADGQGAALAELRCETDFVATNDGFMQLANTIAGQVARTGITEVEQFKTSTLPDGRTVDDMMVDAFGKMKENLAIHRLAKIDGAGACYVHHNGKVGAVVTCDSDPGEAGRHVCMHVASTPLILGLVREDVDPAAVKEAREIAREGAAGKPEQIIEKIVDGKMRKWYSERVLVEQPFVMDDKKSVGGFAKESGFAIKAFLKYEVGGLG
ncbi:MAG: translation elongation factor Ts [Phycisphaerae bacterium]|nr:translation elongation factor Ts [Phycisphaerae bacterium]